MNMRVKINCAAVLLFCAACWVAQANAAPSEEWLTFSVENDSFTGSDNNYTNGLGITWVSADLESYDDDRFVSKWGRLWAFLPFVSDEGYTTYAAWTLAQEMHTPDDITNPNPPAGRPALCRRAVRRRPAVRAQGTLDACMATEARRRRPGLAGRQRTARLPRPDRWR